jgi:hypothetical protein
MLYLHDFLKKVGKKLSLPDKKFFRDALIGQPIVCQMARQLPNQHTKFLPRLDLLEEHMLSEGTFDDEVKETLPQVWLFFAGDDMLIILDPGKTDGLS